MIGAAPVGAARPNKWLVAAATMFPATMEVLDTSIANVALDHIRGSLSAGVDEVTWVLTSYLVANGVVLPLTGWLGRLLGRTRFFVGSIVLFTASSVLCGLAPSLPVLVLFRLVQGLAGGALIPTSQTILRETFPPQEQGMAMAVWGIGLMFGPIAGPTLGGWITDNLSWRWIFFINLPIGALAVLLCRAALSDPPDLRPVRGRLDFFGLLLLVVWVGALQIVLDKGEREDWFNSSLIVWLSLAAAAGLAAFVLRELRAESPVVDLRVLRNRSFAVGTALMALMAFGLYGSITMLPLYTQFVLGYTAWLAGLALAPGGVGTLLMMPVAGRLTNRVDTRFIVAVGALLTAMSMFQVSRLTGEVSFAQVLWPRFLQGLGMGLMFVPLSTATLATVPRSEIANASGLFNLMRNIGGSVGIAVATTWLGRGSQVHQSYLASHVDPYHLAARQALGEAARLAAGAGPAGSGMLQGLALLYEMVQRQALLLSFLDVFRLFGWVFLVILPLLLLLRRSRGSGAVAAH